SFDGQNRRDLLLKAATRECQYTRSVYVAVGAPGATLPATVNKTWTAVDDLTTMRGYWRLIRDVAAAYEWTEDSFTKPAWKGTRVRKSGGFKCYLTTPTEIK